MGAVHVTGLVFSDTTSIYVEARGGQQIGQRGKSNDHGPDLVQTVVGFALVQEGRRYVVCFNEEQARKDGADREAIVAGLRQQWPKGGRALVGNKGYRRFAKVDGPGFEIDAAKVQEEERHDGRWVLRTNTDWDAAAVALRYKRLWLVEDVLRQSKSLLGTRPIWHECDDTIGGDMFCSFPALVLRK